MPFSSDGLSARIHRQLLTAQCPLWVRVCVCVLVPARYGPGERSNERFRCLVLCRVMCLALEKSIPSGEHLHLYLHICLAATGQRPATATQLHQPRPPGRRAKPKHQLPSPPTTLLPCNNHKTWVGTVA